MNVDYCNELRKKSTNKNSVIDVPVAMEETENSVRVF